VLALAPVAEGEAAGQVPEARSVVSRHFGSAGRDARETATGRLCQQQRFEQMILEKHAQ